MRAHACVHVCVGVAEAGGRRVETLQEKKRHLRHASNAGKLWRTVCLEWVLPGQHSRENGRKPVMIEDLLVSLGTLNFLV